MDMWRPDAERWLASEHEGQEDAAEAAFAQAFQALPRIEPRADFADRVVSAVWRVERRRHRAVQWAQGAAALLVMAAGLAIGYAAIDYAGAWMATTGAAVASRGVVWFMAMAGAGVTWWSVVARVGAGMDTVLATPQNTAALLALELLGMLALWGLRRLLPSEQNTVDSVEART